MKAEAKGDYYLEITSPSKAMMEASMNLNGVNASSWKCRKTMVR